MGRIGSPRSSSLLLHRFTPCPWRSHIMFSFGRRTKDRCKRKPYRPQAELLEHRCLLATLFPGNPVTPGTPQPFGGSGTAAVQSAIGAFEAAIGGVNNGGGATTSSGFRV